MNADVRIMRECLRRGRHPSQMTAQELHQVRMHVLSAREKAAGATSMAVSVARTEVLGIRVPLPIYDQRRAGCRTCGFFVLSADGVAMCMKCACMDKGLESKWLDPAQECPLPPPERRWGKYAG